MNLTFDQMEECPEVNIKDVDSRITRRRLDNSLDVEFIGKDTEFYSRVRVVLGSRVHPKEGKQKSHFGQEVWSSPKPSESVNSVANVSIRNLETRIEAHDDYSVDVRFFDKRDPAKEYRHVRVMLGSAQTTQETSNQQSSFNQSPPVSRKVSVKERKKLKMMYHF